MAKPAEYATQKATPLPPLRAASRLLRVRHLDVNRTGNDKYTVTEMTLEGPDCGPFVVLESKVLKAGVSQNVARDWVRDWYHAFTGANLTGPYWR